MLARHASCDALQGNVRLSDFAIGKRLSKLLTAIGMVLIHIVDGRVITKTSFFLVFSLSFHWFFGVLL